MVYGRSESRGCLVDASGERIAAGPHDRAINHIFGCGLIVAGVLGRPDVSEEVARRLEDVIDKLDAAVAAIRDAAFAARVQDREGASALTAPEPVAEARAALDEARRRLWRFSDDACAYATHGNDYYRTADHVLWARESNGLLLSARSDTPFARRDGHVFLSLETKRPLYYEDSHDRTETHNEVEAR